jgi:predicted ATPase
VLGDKRLIRTIRLRNLLSFGPKTEETELLGLNVLIGPNGSGKSNLIEAIGLLQACPRDLQAPIRAGGGVAEWLWKGEDQTPQAGIEVGVSCSGPKALRHLLSFTRVGVRFEIVTEVVADECAGPDEYHYRNEHGRAAVKMKAEPFHLSVDAVPGDQSIVSQVRGAPYPQITYLGTEYNRMHLYRNWDTGPQSALRLPQKPDLPQDFLLEDAGNLNLVLDDLVRLVGRGALVERLREFCEPITDIDPRLQGGVMQVFIHERGLRQPIPNVRLSDGTLRYLCLLAILCHPSPPPLICIEEPEIGLHPDILPTIARLLVEASQRTQLIVTTHSQALVDALTETPEAVVVCEKEEGSTTMRRLDKNALKEWLENYSLGHLWRTGELGGNRW